MTGINNDPNKPVQGSQFTPASGAGNAGESSGVRANEEAFNLRPKESPTFEVSPGLSSLGGSSSTTAMFRPSEAALKAFAHIEGRTVEELKSEFAEGTRSYLDSVAANNPAPEDLIGLKHSEQQELFDNQFLMKYALGKA